MADPITQIIEAAEAARPYIEDASKRMYDGTNGHGIREAAKRRLGQLDAALAAARTLQAAGQAEQPAQQTDDISRAADFLEQYADFIRREVMSVDIERHPYLPELEQVAAALRSAASPQQPAQQAPQGARMPLTREQIDALVYQCRQTTDTTYALVALVEAAHGIALPPAAQGEKKQ